MLSNDIEAALKSYLETQLAVPLTTYSATVVTGIDDDEKPSPVIICAAQSGTEEPINSGNFDMPCSVELRWAVSDSDRDDADTLGEALLNAIEVHELAANLNALDATVHINGVFNRSVSISKEPDAWRFASDFTVSARAVR